MKRLYLHLASRFYEARAQRALLQHHQFKALAAKFFSRLQQMRGRE